MAASTIGGGPQTYASTSVRSPSRRSTTSVMRPASPAQPSSDSAGTKLAGQAGQLLEVEQVGLGARAVVVRRLAVDRCPSSDRSSERIGAMPAPPPMNSSRRGELGSQREDPVGPVTDSSSPGLMAPSASRPEKRPPG